MHPSGTRYGQGPFSPEDRAKMAFDQQQLTARLIRSRGHQLLAGTAAPVSSKTGTMLNTTHTTSLSSIPSITQKNTKAGSAQAAPIEVPRPLQPMLGSKLQLHSTASQTMLSGKLTNPADVHLSNPFISASAFSKTKDLSRTTRPSSGFDDPEASPTPSKRSRTATSIISPELSPSKPSTAVAPSRVVEKKDQVPLTSLRPTAPVGVDPNSPEYLSYLQSPFSFIDKVIENPFTEEFVYLTATEPYHLRIVRHDEINPNDYYTMSRAGVTHFLNGDATFTSLDQWEREYFLYMKMRQVDFFSQFRSWKSFYFWKKLVNQTKLTRFSHHLKEHHFLLNTVLCSALLRLKHLCVEAGTWSLLKLDTRAPQTLASFRAIQAQQRDHVTESLTQLSAESVRILSEACDADLRQFLITNGFRKSDQSNEEAGSRESKSVLSHSLVPTATEGGHKISRAEKAAQHTRLRRLLKFIRLADMHIVNTLCVLCRDRADELMQAIQKTYEITIPHIDARLNPDGTPTQQATASIGAMALRAHTQAHGSLSTAAASAAAAAAMTASVNAALALKKKRAENRVENALFVVEVELDAATGDLIFSPSEEEFELVIEQAIDNGAVKVMSRNKLCNEEAFEEYVTTAAQDGEVEENDSHFVDMVLDDPVVLNIKQQIKQGIHKAFQLAWAYASQLQSFAEMYMENAAMDISIYRNAAVHTFSELITKYETQLIDCYALRTVTDIGILSVDTTKLREMLLPSPMKIRTDIMSLMPAIAREKCIEMVAELSKSNDELSRVPADVAEFVNIMTLLKTIGDNQEQTNHRFVFIQELFTVIQDAQGKLEDADKVLLEQLSQIRHQFKTTVMLTEASLQANIEKFTKDLQAKLPELLEELVSITTSLQDPIIFDPHSDKDQVIDMLRDVNSHLKRLEVQASNYQHYQDILGAEVSQYDKLREARLDMNVKLEVWEAYKTWEDFTDKWLKMPFSSIDVDIMARELSVYGKTYGRAKRRLEGASIVEVFKANIDEFGSVLPVITDLRNPHLLDRHWSDITKLLQHNILSDANFCLGTLLERNATTHAHSINIISFKARQEAILQEQLSKVQNIWSELAFPLLPYKNQKDMHILGSLDDILIVLDESIVTLASILGSHYVEPLRREAVELSHQLSQFQLVLEEWTACQRQWMYLESIFSWQDIIRQLPDESTLFSQVTKGFVQIMRRTTDNPNCLSAGLYGGLKETFQSYNVTLDKINKHLESYLETKRVAFPRFYFLSNDELIKIMSNQKSHHSVQPHLRKCFDNLVKLDFQDKDIKAMISAEGERVPLGQNLKVRNNVETWLGDLEKDMVKSLRKLMKRGLIEYDHMTRAQWILDKFAQVVMTGTQIIWSRNIEKALLSEGDKGKELSKWYDTQLKQLQELTAMVRGNLSAIDRKKLVTLITTDVHARDVTHTLIERKVRDVHNFDWQQQLRFYWDTQEDDCVIRQANAKFLYGYEYMGVTSRLVITPLTDRCWITITGALHIRYGASPAGPAGTGKTESVKDLAKAMGIFCVVFNCSEQINYMMMQKLFSGLAQTGAWACLDEFNRIDIEVLSVIAQQLLQIRQALLQNQQLFTFQGQVIKLQKSCGVMITMNPGYAGRTELPDNLKVLFRPVAMMVPDYAMIAEIMLFSEGFEHATVLSKKMVQLYKLASEQLSQQDHYDFGMRAVKSVLVMAGALKRAQPDLDESTVLIRAMRDSNIPKFVAQDLPLFDAIVQDLFPDAKIPNVDHGELTTAIQRNLLERGLQPVPKFINKVLQLYDTFNVRFGVMLVGPSGGGKSTCWTTLAQSLSQLKEEGRHGTTYDTVHSHVLNPKAVSMGELFGDLNELSQEWKEGLASNIFREAIRDNTSDRHWVVFDGPVDALWVENMNTVLDDSMMLCLSTGERIKLKHELRVLFEVQDLAVASPATVSRCGMVYMTPSDIGVMPYVKSWIDKQTYLPRAVREHLYSEFTVKVPLALTYIHEQGMQPITCSDLSLIVAICRILETLFDPLVRASQQLEWVDHHTACTKDANASAAAAAAAANPLTAAPPSTEASLPAPDTAAAETPMSPLPPAEVVVEEWCHVLADNKTLVDMCFAYAFAWGMGGSLDSDSQPGFSKLLHELFLNVKPPGTFYDVYLDVNDKAWKPWDNLVAPYTYSPSQSYFQILVPTVDNVRYRVLTQDLLSLSHPVFLTATTGVGKTVLIQDMLNRIRTRSALFRDGKYDQSSVGYPHAISALSPQERDELAVRSHITTLNITFSAQSSSLKTQETIESRLIKLKATQLGAPQGRRLVLHIDDVNMPAVEKFGSQPPIELLRQLLDYGGFYDRTGLFWKEIVNTGMLCSAAPPGGGRSALSPRFTRHFTTLCMPAPSESSLKRIFNAIYQGWVSANGFKQAIVKLGDPIVASTIELYQTISRELLPTPAKSHYTFNLRDISKVFQGILSIKPVACSSTNTMTRLWLHECERCFEDRLVNEEDKTWCTQKLTQLVQKNFNVDWRHDGLFKNSFITFCDFMNEGDKMYEEVNDPYKLVTVLDSYLEQYNMTYPTKSMRLVFFQDAVKHLIRISRIIRQPRGNAMLVGVGGSGKQSLTRLACFMAEYECAQIQISKNYSYNDFREFLKKLCISTGVKGQNVVFLLTEQQIMDERFLEDVNNLLNNGEVPNLYPKDEQQKALEDLASVLREERMQQEQTELPTTGDASDGNTLYNTFVNRVRDNLHLVLCLSPVGEAFRQRLRMFPSLINCTTIDWFLPWPEEALLSVAQAMLQDVDCEEEVKETLAAQSVIVHTSVEKACAEFKNQYRRSVYTTPKSYLDLLGLYRDMVRKQRDKLESRRLHLLTGLRRLKDTQNIVADLQITLEKLRPTLVEKAKETETLLQKVAVDSEKADKVRALVEIEEKQVSIQTAHVREEEASARANLELAMPALRAAVKALEKLRKAEISEVKSLPSPPVQVVRVLEAVCILLGENPDWDTAKKVLTNVNFVKMLRDYPKENIDAKMIRKLNKYVTDPQLAEDKMYLISRAACSMMMWVQAMHTYYHVDREVAPKIARVEELKAKLEEAESRLKSKQDELNAVVENVKVLQDRCRATEAEKAALDEKSRQTEARLDRAQQLIELLSGEEVRWSHDSASLQHQLQFVVGDVFIATACLSYYGAFTGDYRSNLINLWLENLRKTEIIPVSESFSIQQCLGNAMDIRQWQINGLPTDEVSVDSALICVNSARWPLIIDPQEQAKKWLKNEKKNKLHITRMGGKDMLKKLELCLRNGLTLLIEDIGEHVDSVLDPVLYKQTFTHGGRTMVRIGESDIDYDPRFQLFMTTKLANPMYLPEVCIKVNLINFTVTPQGMQDQLLGEVVRRERADVEDKKNRLVVSMTQDRKELNNIEEKILTLLQESQTLILDDIELIETLKESKTTSQVIMDRVQQARETQESIEAIRQQYVPVALRGSIIYFTISDLAVIDPMYQYSLDFFIRFFNMCIDNTPVDDNIQVRIQSLLDTITILFFNNICRGLFEKHKLLFSFSLMCAILRNQGLISSVEWASLLRGASIDAVVTSPTPNPLPAHVLADNSWDNLQKLALSLPVMQRVVHSMITEPQQWANWIADDNIASSPLPHPFQDTLSPFMKLLITKSVRLHQFPSALRVFMSQYPEGRALSSPRQASLVDTFKDSDSKTPIVFILSTGADPTALLFRLAEEMGISERLHVLSLGQGQGEKAKKLVETAMRKGDWVLLQNCHLAKSWMGQLEAIVEQMDNVDEQYKILPSFRLWLTSMPSADFPVSVLQRGIKITNEPPQGIRANLLRSYTNVLKPEDTAEITNAITPDGPVCVTPLVYRNLLFSLCFFHAIIQERHKFGPLGWNKPYEFNDSDLETAVTVLRMALSEHDHIPWDTLQFMTGQICYGGRVTDDWDRRCLMTVLQQLYAAHVVGADTTDNTGAGAGVLHRHQFTPSGTYFMPASASACDAQVYVDYVTTLPAQDEPEVFGMDTNANITCLSQQSHVMLQTLLTVQPRDAAVAGARTPDDIVSEVANEMETKLPSVLDMREAGPTTFAVEEDDDPFNLNEDEEEEDDMGEQRDSEKSVSVDSLAEFLKQEMERCNRVLNTVKSTLIDLQRAIKGQVVMSQELDTMYTSLLNNQVPRLWARVAPPSLKSLSAWIVDLHARVAALRDWLRNGKPVSFWLSGFFFQQGFLTGVLQTHARRYRIPIDTISFSHTLLPHYNVEELSNSAEDGVFVHGLFTVGAEWNAQRNVLEDAPTGVLVSPLPVLHLLPREAFQQQPNTYVCPVYKTAVRAGELSTTGHSTNFVVDVHLPTEKQPDYWVLKGVAILCQPDSA